MPFQASHFFSRSKQIKNECDLCGKEQIYPKIPPGEIAHLPHARTIDKLLIKFNDDLKTSGQESLYTLVEKGETKNIAGHNMAYNIFFLI